MRHNRITYPDRAAWLQGREQGIGASEAATVLGLNPYETPLQLWRRKVGIDPPKPQTDAMRRGHYCEDAVAQWWAHSTGRDIIAASKDDFMFVDPEREYLRVSPDRTYWLPDMPRNDDNKGILECKTTLMAVDPDDLPQAWFCQLQMNLGVAGYSHGSLAWLARGLEFGSVDIDLVPSFYDMMAAAIEEFWLKNVKERIEPLPINAADVAAAFPTHDAGALVEATDKQAAECARLRQVKDAIADLEKEKAALEDSIKMAIGPAEGIARDGRTLATWKSGKPATRLDEKALKAEMPDIYAQFARETPAARRFLLK